MRAVQVSALGGAEGLTLVPHEVGAPGPGEVRLRVRAAALNLADLLQREGLYLGGPRPPFVPGLEAVGEIEAVGAGVSFVVGERLIALARGGLLATHAILPASACRPAPPSLDDPEAAALPVSALTATLALERLARAQPGERALIHAAAGGLGSAAVQVAKGLGLEVVAVASTEPKRALARELGADLALGYEEVGPALRARRPDVVLDGVGGAPLRTALRVLAPLGRAVLVGWVEGPSPAWDPVQLVHRSQAILGCHLDALREQPSLCTELLARVDQRVAAGSLRPHVGAVLPLERAAEGYALLQDRARCGKIVLVP